MTTRSATVAVASIALLSLGGFSVRAQQNAASQKMPWQIGTSGYTSRQSAPVVFTAPAEIHVPANKISVIDLHFRVADGLHINSHHPHDGSLVPTQLLVAENGGLDTKAVDFPAGVDQSFAFAPSQKLNVYTGEVVLEAHILARPGDHLLQGVMRYQACDNSECMPPKKAMFAVDVLAR